MELFCISDSLLCSGMMVNSICGGIVYSSVESMLALIYLYAEICYVLILSIWGRINLHLLESIRTGIFSVHIFTYLEKHVYVFTSMFIFQVKTTVTLTKFQLKYDILLYEK